MQSADRHGDLTNAPLETFDSAETCRVVASRVPETAHFAPGTSVAPRSRVKRARVVVAMAAFVAVVAAGIPPARADGVQTAGDILQFVPALTGLGLTYYYGADADRAARIESGETTDPEQKNLGYRLLFGRDATGRLQLAESGAATGATVLILKAAVDKRRPNGGKHSFPSGHAADAAWGAAFLQRRYGWAYGVPAYLLTGFVAWSRVESHEHFSEDVIAGAAIGIVGSYIFTRPYHGVEVTPVAGGGVYGVALRTAW
jgi:membrane-associated phospholipid phosphatase